MRDNSKSFHPNNIGTYSCASSDGEENRIILLLILPTILFRLRRKSSLENHFPFPLPPRSRLSAKRRRFHYKALAHAWLLGKGCDIRQDVLMFRVCWGGKSHNREIKQCRRDKSRIYFSLNKSPPLAFTRFIIISLGGFSKWGSISSGESVVISNRHSMARLTLFLPFSFSIDEDRMKHEQETNTCNG